MSRRLDWDKGEYSIEGVIESCCVYSSGPIRCTNLEISVEDEGIITALLHVPNRSLRKGDTIKGYWDKNSNSDVLHFKRYELLKSLEDSTIIFKEII